MRRRDWLLEVVGFLAAGAALRPGRAAAADTSLSTEVVRLRLRHTWTTTMSSSEYRDTLFVRLAATGRRASAKAPPSSAIRRAPRAGRRRWRASVTTSREPTPGPGSGSSTSSAVGCPDSMPRRPPWTSHCTIGRARSSAARCTGSSVSTARMRPSRPSRSASTRPRSRARRCGRPRAFPVLKIKVGLDTDEPTLEAVRSVTKKPLRVDANEGWKDKDEALRRIKWLETQRRGAHRAADARGHAGRAALAALSRLMPIFADESCLRLADIPKIADAYDGINVKVDKAGGLLAALRMIDAARAHGLQVMLGCMVSSSVAITAAAHLSPLVDFADLDGNLLVANDPFAGVTVRERKLVLPDGPGLGLMPAAGANSVRNG